MRALEWSTKVCFEHIKKNECGVIPPDSQPYVFVQLHPTQNKGMFFVLPSFILVTCLLVFIVTDSRPR